MNNLTTRNQAAAIALWVQAKAYELTVAVMNRREIAQVITEMGRGIRPGRLEGVEYPPNYSITHQSVTQAFRQYCKRNPLPGLEEMRRLDTQRCDDIYRAMLPMIRKGGRDSALAADAATRALAHKARINGMDAPIKIAATDRMGRDFIPIPIATVHKIMEGGDVVLPRARPSA
jgi:hypothetical protein